MGELLGIPEWLAATLFVMAALTIWPTVSYAAHRRAHRRMAERRPNPTREEFIAMLDDEIDPDIAGWLWRQAEFYYRPLTPHPEDHLLKDACIDGDDIDMDWPREYADWAGIEERHLPPFPPDWDLTIHNFGRWLKMGREKAQTGEI